MFVIGRCGHPERYPRVYKPVDLSEEHHSAPFRGSGSIMASFAKLMRTFGTSQPGVDFIAALPVEIAELILLKLDPRSLLNVASVSRKWMNVCKGSSRLRKTTRHHLRTQKKLLIQDDLTLDKRSKKQTAMRTSRMQTDLAQRMSRQGTTLPMFFGATGVIKTSALNSRSKTKKSVSHVPLIPTRSSLKLR